MSEKVVHYIEGVPPPSDQHVLARVINENGNEKGLIWVLPDNSEKNPFQHEDVDTLVPMLRWQWRHLKNYLTFQRAFEDWEAEFLRDENPSQEVALWSTGTYAFLEFTHQNPLADRSVVFAIIAELMVGEEIQAKPKSTLQELKELLSNSPRELANTGSFTEDGCFKTSVEHLR